MRNNFLPMAASTQALPTATAPGAYIAVGGTYALFQSGYGQQVPGGAGLYVDVNAIRQLGIEAERHRRTVRR
jgi:hypothetical protein